MDQTTVDAILGVVRHALTTAGGGLVTAGYLSSDNLTQIVGGVIALLGVGWSIYQKKHAKPAVAS